MATDAATAEWRGGGQESALTTDPASPADEDSSSSADTIGIGGAQERAREAAEEMLEHEFEGVIKVEAADDNGWRTVVEVVERGAVPDTQDSIGRCGLTLTPTPRTSAGWAMV